MSDVAMNALSPPAPVAARPPRLQEDPELLAKVLALYVAPVIFTDAAKNALCAANLPVPWNPNNLSGYTRDLVENLCATKALPAFLGEIVRSASTPVFEQILHGALFVDDDGKLTQSSLQSLQATGQAYLNSAIFGDFLVSARMQVCAIWVRRPEWPPGEGRILGSGFLIDRDKVMTAWHVLQPVLRGQADAPEEVAGAEIRCIFDYFGPVPEAMNPSFQIPATMTSYAAAPEKWLLWSSPKHPDDGLSRIFRPDPDVRKNMDCAVIALAEPVGLMSTRRGGGRRRSWLDLSGLTGDIFMKEGDYVVMIHHPGGLDQATSLDRYLGSEPANTRLWYAASAQGGSSGSPCFDSKGRLIALHNSGRLDKVAKPEDACNQGIRMASILMTMPKELLTPTPAAPTADTLWEIADKEGKPKAVLGRLRFKELVLDMTDPTSKRRALIVKEKDNVAGQADGSARNTGKSYSADILRALTRDRMSFVLCFDAKDLQCLTPLGFLKELFFKLGSTSVIETAPEKPDDERQLSRWASSELPNWFGQVIEDWALGQHLTSGKVPAPATGTAAETALHLGVTVWIVIDNIHRIPVERELRELIAGLVGVTDSQVAQRRGLGALRWLFIGNIPDFVRDSTARADLVAVDDISPTEIAEEEWVQFVRAYEASRGGISHEAELHVRAAYAMSEGLINGQDRLSALSNCATLYLRKLIEFTTRS